MRWWRRLWQAIPFLGQKPKEEKPEIQPKETAIQPPSLLSELRQREERIEAKWRVLLEKEKNLEQRQLALEKREENLWQEKQKLERLKKKAEKKLEEIAGLSQKEAQSLVVAQTEKKLTAWLAKKIRQTKEELQARQEELAREILLDAIKHGVTDWVAEYTVSTVKLPDEETKGKIIGREGRNIRAFERATGVEIELDEGNEVRLSSFDPVRREIAKIALRRLIKDGRIQPARIEEIVAQTKRQMDKILMEEGRQICQACGVYSLPIDLVKIIGRYKYRFSFGQNLARHTIEETKIGVALAHELKADVKTVRLGCLLHDIGKVITEDEGNHVQLGVDLLRRYRLPEKVIACVAEHHEDRPFSCWESVIVWIADAASGARPGARYQAHEEYYKRLSEIEEIVKGFEGVADVAVYQAGREIRVIVEPEKISDDELTVLVQKIAESLENQAKWAGQIKVTAIRETRATAVAP